MSVDTFVFLRDKRLPMVQEWQHALDLAKTGIVLEDIGDLRKHTGYLPAKFKGHESGFEWFYGLVKDTFGDKPSEIGDRTHAADLVTHSDMRERICALMAGAVLTKLADGLFLDEDSNGFIDGEKAMDLARQAETMEF
jgi:hypothetical protein